MIFRLSTLLITAILWGFLPGRAAVVPIATQGVLDLRAWDFGEHPQVELRGEWGFYWEKLLAPTDAFPGGEFISVPKSWNRVPDAHGGYHPAQGYGTYRLHVLLPSKHSPLRVDIPPQSTAFRGWANQQWLGEVGVVHSESTQSRARLGHLRMSEENWGDTLSLVIQVSNRKHFRGGLWKPPILGNAEAMQRNEFLLFSLRLFALGGLVLVLVYHLVLYFYRRRDTVQIIFCGVAAVAIVRQVIPGDHLLREWFPILSFEFIIRVEYIALGWTLALLFLFAHAFYPREIPRWTCRFLVASASAYTLFSLAAPLPLLTWSQVYYQFVHMIFAPILIWGVGRATGHKRQGALALLIAFSLLFIATINDTLQARQIIHTGYWAPYVLILVVFSQWFLLARRYSMAYAQAEQQLEEFLLALANAIESKDLYTGGHVERVANYSRDLARLLGLPEDEVHQIYLGAIVHDVGKIGVPDAVLNKPGKLNDDEYAIMKTHTVKGFDLLRRITGTDVAARIALHHQERWNGMGYPRALAGREIPLEARIVAIADYWDAISSDRPYRAAMDIDEALEVLRQERNRGLDPQMLDIFIERGLWKRHLDCGRAVENPKGG